MVLSWNKGKWLHSHETLINSKVTYSVKLVGVIEVSEARGMEIVKEALQKLKFSRHIKRSEGTKPPKVELSINIHGMRLSDPRTKEVLHDIKLHHVSFCADDKEDKRMFSFIAKESDGKHLCYGLDSLHEANDITLTIGQAFELAYDRYLKTDKGMATSKQVVELNKKIAELENENAKLKKWILKLETGKTPTSSPGNSPARANSTPTKHVTAKPSPQKQRDVFDMQPFDGNTKTSKDGSPIIRLPSPDEVHPTRTPNRRRTNKQQNDLAKQLFDDPLGELSRLDRQLSLQSEQPEANYENQSEILSKIMKTSKLSSLLQQQNLTASGDKQGQGLTLDTRSRQKYLQAADERSDEKYQRQKQRLKNLEPISVQPSTPVMEPEISLDAFDPLK